MEEQEWLQALMAKQIRLLNRVKALLQQAEELATFLKNSSEQQSMCMGSICCRSPNDTNSHRP